jgi:hypothetical protein
MNINRVSILALFVATSYIPTAFGGESVAVAAEEAEIVVAPRAANLKLIELPALDFALRATFECTGMAESLTLSVADTYTTLGQDAIADQRSANLLLTVPAPQLSLAASSSFCLRDDLASANELLVPGLATAHASLRCRTDEGVTVHFASAPLQVRLNCGRPSTEDQGPPSDR